MLAIAQRFTIDAYVQKTLFAPLAADPGMPITDVTQSRRLGRDNRVGVGIAF